MPHGAQPAVHQLALPRDKQIGPFVGTHPTPTPHPYPVVGRTCLKAVKKTPVKQMWDRYSKISVKILSKWERWCCHHQTQGYC